MEDAFRALLNLKPGLKVEMAIELYLKAEVSLSKSAEMGVWISKVLRMYKK
ncbi:MAG: hypothetical protein P1P69_07335 [Methanosarcinaceae archaeon]|nr:hypothetical protein [Methanosarcinaceae archaeon]